MISDKTIKTITDADLGLSPKLSGASKSTRTGARAILFDESGRVALVYEHRYDHYKLPGGCVEAGGLGGAKSKRRSALASKICAISGPCARIYPGTTKIAISIISPPKLTASSAKALGLTRRSCTVAR